MTGVPAAVPQRRGFEEFTLLVLAVVALFAGLALDAVPAPGLGVPLNSMAAGLIILLALVVKPHPLRTPSWLMAGVASLAAWLGVASLIAQGPAGMDMRRLLSILVWAGLAIVIGSGRFSPRAMGLGLAGAVFIGAFSGFATFTSSSYAGRLTGVMGDPNTAAFMILTFTCLALPSLRHRWVMSVLAGTAALAIFLTFSRTTYLATVCVLLWVFFGRRVRRWIGMLAVGAVALIGLTIDESAAAVGQFSARAGSDQLRARILESEQVLVDSSPMIGHGLGTAKVSVGEQTFFFHSSYLSLRQEGGWIALALFLIIVVALLISLSRLPATRRAVWTEAALIGAGICAINLGEVFLTFPTAVTLGFAAYLLGWHGRYPADPVLRAPQRLL